MKGDGSRMGPGGQEFYVAFQQSAAQGIRGHLAPHHPELAVLHLLLYLAFQEGRFCTSADVTSRQCQGLFNIRTACCTTMDEALSRNSTRQSVVCLTSSQFGLVHICHALANVELRVILPEDPLSADCSKQRIRFQKSAH